jgi:hypothetical protein
MRGHVRVWGKSRHHKAEAPCPLLTDAVEKGQNEPIEIFACALVETGFS